MTIQDEQLGCLSSNDLNRFWSKVEIGPSCWLWRGTQGPQGYGVFKAKGRMFRAHRIAYFDQHGSVGDLLVCHHCDVPGCVNPEHLFLGTALDNRRDCHAKGRQALGLRTRPETRAKGERHPSAKLTTEQVREMRTLRSLGRSFRELGKLFSVSFVAARYVCIGRTWKHV